MPFFEGKLLNKTLTIEILKKICISRKLSCEYFFSPGVPLKKSIYVCFLRPKTSNPKGRSNRLASVRACPYSFLHLKSYPLMAPTEMNPTSLTPTGAGEERVRS